MRNTDRRADALSKERIIEAAVEMLDAAGESGLTFRALSAQLSTGAGAIYWHVANKGELLVAATDTMLAAAMAVEDAPRAPAAAIRAIALGVFDAVEAHPWIGDQMTRLSGQSSTLRIFERIGRHVQALGVPEAAQFDAASALLNYIQGVAAQNAALSRSVTQGTDRADVLETVSAMWASLDTDDFPFLRTIAGKLRDHDDREQFVAGIDLILAGIESRWPAGPRGLPRDVGGDRHPDRC
ncbi:TetR family transcriptional regulator [Actinoplanes sp. SE50]|uniref:TetR/AcrR family transcriptional regulator C-terminal domain-containing protein n=1 Tax=unclassified Actinoplanes TaxID=2626549 RepID=UPI00023EC120|nr:MULTISPECIES: TetR/AcrR family transcriptional regulator C-terminal domain-containing protein [unclassified Actinoplanes]AEV85780.1 Tetracycline repressor protein class B from transposon Tn10 [Actinoplanes sp. SE50/110]ATO84174.1 TetR family transcriptional regulator [Actinoplanes sp. SE50]SLM01584.1 TetR family transcriptional regulator [Actinoplanes sp. SE50/110]